MAKRHMKRCSTWLIIREMQIETAMKYHLKAVRMTIIKKATNRKCWQVLRKGNPPTLLGGNVNWYNNYGEQYGGSSKTKNKSTI